MHITAIKIFEHLNAVILYTAYDNFSFVKRMLLIQTHKSHSSCFILSRAKIIFAAYGLNTSF